jgi:hypothetical protein
VLIHNRPNTGVSDRNNQPPEHAATTSPTDTANTAGPHARRTAATAAPICATASATGLPAGANRSRSPPAFTHRSTSANPTRIGSACAANRDNQPRTVEAGRPTIAVIRRHPHPRARARNADQITPTTSTRRPSTTRGNNTCDRPHPAAPEQIPRRGRIRPTGPSAADRTNRAAAHPHGANRCPQSGHPNPPETNRHSTATGSGPTLSNDRLRARTNGPSPTASQSTRGRAVSLPKPRNPLRPPSSP